MCKFFDPTGEEISIDQFISNYSKCYFINNSKFVEDRIEELLKAEQLSAKDVMLILRWKMGRIDAKASQAMKKCILPPKDARKSFITYTGRGRIVDAESFCNEISDLTQKSKGPCSAEEIWNAFVPNEKLSQNINVPENMGTVYLLTVLYFLTNAEYPIYDRFAKMALDAISNKEGIIKPGDAIHYMELPAKTDGGFKSLLNSPNSKYRKYITELETVFGERYTANKQNRDIDRALWVYGHLFRDKTKKATYE